MQAVLAESEAAEAAGVAAASGPAWERGRAELRKQEAVLDRDLGQCALWAARWRLQRIRQLEQRLKEGADEGEDEAKLRGELTEACAEFAEWGLQAVQWGMAEGRELAAARTKQASLLSDGRRREMRAEEDRLSAEIGEIALVAAQSKMSSMATIEEALADPNLSNEEREALEQQEASARADLSDLALQAALFEGKRVTDARLLLEEEQAEEQREVLQEQVGGMRVYICVYHLHVFISTCEHT